jgi:signal peptidase II
MIYVILIALIVVFDQLIKIAAVSALVPGQPFHFIPGAVDFTIIQNDKGAMSLGLGSMTVMIILSLALAVILAVALWRVRKNPSRLLKISLCFIVGGAIGNLIDRVFLGYVRDMIFLRFFPFDFNVADSFVCIGAVMLGIYLLFFWDKSKKDKTDKIDG